MVKRNRMCRENAELCDRCVGLSYRITPPVTHLRDPTFDTGADPWNDTSSNVN